MIFPLLRPLQPLLRTCGLALVVVFVLANFGVDEPLPLANPGLGVPWVEAFLWRSVILGMGLLMVLLSLAPRAVPELAQDPVGADRVPGRRREGLLIRARPLLLVLVVLYLGLIPYVWIGSLEVRKAGLAFLEQEYAGTRSRIATIKRELEANPGPVASPALVARYPWLRDAKGNTATVERIRLQMLYASQRARRDHESKLRHGELDFVLRTLRLTLSALLYGLLFVLFWRSWPRSPALPPRERQ